ncbi:hypothetical protein ONZ51_g12081 [Trametes cubensis]|uniref:Uncharacterized protein n=1 Tax=Trametes cubensis TaxID=1111947 RepID=A0AAD7TIY4_9APHY|nr:hypothetical protein ONZ51_g12081 [Trametes cubensis]
MPWAEWDVFAPVSHYLLYFTPAEVERIWEEASSAGGFEGARVSRLDALLAFVWGLIIRARGMECDPELVHMFVTIGARTRLAPPLPNTFLGSPIVLARVSLPAEQVASSGPSTDCGVGARAIRSAVSCFSPAALGAYLHDAAHEVNPQRFWRAFLGRRHSIVTSWQNLDAYGVDFGSGAPPRLSDEIRIGPTRIDIRIASLPSRKIWYWVSTYEHLTHPTSCAHTQGMSTSDASSLSYENNTPAGSRQLLLAYIVSFCIECLLFGCRGKPSTRDWCIYTASTAMFVLALTAPQHLLLSLTLMLLVFVTHAGSLSSISLTLYDPSGWDSGDALSSTIFTAKFAVYVTQTLIGDAFMGYRLYVIWSGRKTILIVPALLFFTSMTDALINITFAWEGTGYGSLSRGYLLLLLPMAFSAASCLSSVLFTVLVMWRILSPDRWAAAPRALSKRYDMARKAGEAIVQSAAVYCVASTVLVLTYFLSRNKGWTACLNAFPPLIGLVFSFIVKRIARHSISNSLCTLPTFASKTLNERDLTPARRRMFPPVTRSRSLSAGTLITINPPALDTSSDPVPTFATLPDSRSASFFEIEKSTRQQNVPLKTPEDTV